METTLNAAPTITTEPVLVGRDRTPMFVAHGPDGHHWLLKRLTAEAASADGLAYFLATRRLDDSGRWVVS